ncbi:MAG: 16S rRNA (cytidine(1402)-2'-O)-methyltransferase [Oscillospiraceae bacterium]|nr:16S rRNA (cytidine(1402)-2'-O)-methyltransferase [Oscillospiraceae bacterium]
MNHDESRSLSTGRIQVYPRLAATPVTTRQEDEAAALAPQACPPDAVAAALGPALGQPEPEPEVAAVRPGLYLVGTPLGNLADWSARAQAVLQAVDLVACEDTRRSGLLFSQFGIRQHLISYHEHNKAQRTPGLLRFLSQGHSLALVTDAGMPAISDPGSDLAAAAADAGFPVTVIPGPTAAMTALAASGLDSRRFTFEGFLPVKGKDRAVRLKQLAREERTQILYEAPHRLQKTLEDLLQAGLGQRRLVLGRELTKRYEEYLRLTVEQAREHYQTVRPLGEFTLILEGQEAFNARRPEADPLQTPPEADDLDLQAKLRQLLQSGLSVKACAAQLSEETGRSRNELYRLCLNLKNKFTDP